MRTEIVHRGEHTLGVLLDVSPQGAFVQTDAPLLVGEEAELWFADESLAPQVARARVVRRRAAHSGLAASRAGMGVAWLEPPAFARELLSDTSPGIEIEIDPGDLDAVSTEGSESERSASDPPTPQSQAPAAEPTTSEPADELAAAPAVTRESEPAPISDPSEPKGEIVAIGSHSIAKRRLAQAFDPAVSLVRADVVVIDEGELTAIEILLRSLGAATHRMRWGAQTEPFAWEAPPRLVIVSARVALAVSLSDAVLGSGALGIAVCDSDASTLRAQLRRQGYDLAVQRSAHPATLRLLLASLLFQKRERRAARRRAFGAPIRFWRGFRRTHGVLLELSPKNASLLLPQALPAGTRLTVRLAATHAAGRALALPAVVARSSPAEVGALVAVRFSQLAPRKSARLEALVKQLELSGPVPQPTGRRAFDGALRERPRSERRGGARVPLAQQALALDERTGVARDVLFGSDLSLGGMRIEPHPQLARGAQLRLALQPPGGAPPVTLAAEVARDDGERGLVLRFVAVSPITRLALERILDAAAEVERTRRTRAADERLVLGTLVEATNAS